jgi:hypothetical protein
MPANGMFAAHCNEREFGTSRWQLYRKATSASRAVGRGRHLIFCSAGVCTWPFSTGHIFARSLRFRGTADIRRLATIAGCDAIDPKATLNAGAVAVSLCVCPNWSFMK